ncbi:MULTISPECIES: hypothetical protein [unclassified Streptomyces]|uniref:hypothetical protein n=1 Tax=unclassified Streptomyces TaxID=2593676 RepID=UPI00109ED9F1|nr:hypothetical protein [Streptomyces sp. A1136]THA59163.1 hypothetical protein E6R62_00445 [Streptomyces sp. A1136]
MARAQWVVGALTVTLLGTGVAMLHSTQGAEPEAVTVSDALPSRALGLTGHRRLVRELEHGGEYPGQAGPDASGAGSRPARGSSTTQVLPMRAARPVRLRVPSLEVDVHVSARNPEGRVRWDPESPAPGSAGIAVVSGKELRLAGLRRGRLIEVARADHRTAVFTVVRVVPVEAGGMPEPRKRAERTERPERAGLRLVGGDAVVLARLTGRHHTR